MILFSSLVLPSKLVISSPWFQLIPISILLFFFLSNTSLFFLAFLSLKTLFIILFSITLTCCVCKLIFLSCSILRTPFKFSLFDESIISSFSFPSISLGSWSNFIFYKNNELPFSRAFFNFFGLPMPLFILITSLSL